MNTQVKTTHLSSNHNASLLDGLNARNGHLGEYALATGPAAVRRLLALHNIYGPAGRRVLLRAGLKPGMHVADFCCSILPIRRDVFVRCATF
jgi:hypothetical protein